MKLVKHTRDKGKSIPGQIIKGSSEPRLTAPSIPSIKKHQIQYKQATSAFGACSQRFSTTTSVNKQTGPGSYDINTNPQNPSFSKKGFGSMLSKMSRSMTIFNKGPGPTHYSHAQTSFINKSSKKRAPMFPKSQNQGLFWSESGKMNTPGPFQYNSIKTARASNISSSSFKSSIKRWKQKILQQNPSPFSYNPKQTLVSKRSRGIIIQQKKPISKQTVLQSLFGKQKQKNGPGEYIKQKSQTQLIKTRETGGFKFINQPIANLNKIASIIPNPNYKQFLQASITARSKKFQERDYTSTMSIAKASY